MAVDQSLVVPVLYSVFGEGGKGVFGAEEFIELGEVFDARLLARIGSRDFLQNLQRQDQLGRPRFLRHRLLLGGRVVGVGRRGLHLGVAAVTVVTCLTKSKWCWPS